MLPYKCLEADVESICAELRIRNDPAEGAEEANKNEPQLDFELAIGTEFEAFSAVFIVAHIYNTYVICTVIESENPTYDVDDERQFSREDDVYHVSNYIEIAN